MKFLVLTVSVFCFGFAHAQQSYRIKLLSNWNNPNLNKVDSINIWSDVTCWHDSTTGREYAIAGSTDSIYFFDITDPTKIALRDVEFGANTQMVNRDYETYLNYVYCVSDNKNPGKLQVFDLKYLPDSVHKVYESDSLGFNTHTVFIEAKSKRLYMGVNRFKGFVSAMDILSIENPENPTFLARLEVPKDITGQPVFKGVHEPYVRNDTAYCSVEYAGLFIFDLRDLNNQRLLGTIQNYPKNGYNHSNWLSKNGKKIMFTDEVPVGLDIKIMDISDVSNPRLDAMFNSHKGATAHNAYWVGDFAYVSSYEDGLYIYNIRDTKHPYVEAWYDTYPLNNAGEYHGYQGCWGVYPFLPSGNIVATDRTFGIFVLKPDSGLLEVDEAINPKQILLYPNPATDFVNVQFTFQNKISYQISNINGSEVLKGVLNTGEFQHQISINTLSKGIYFLKFWVDGKMVVKKLIRN